MKMAARKQPSYESRTRASATKCERSCQWCWKEGRRQSQSKIWPGRRARPFELWIHCEQVCPSRFKPDLKVVQNRVNTGRIILLVFRRTLVAKARGRASQ